MLNACTVSQAVQPLCGNLVKRTVASLYGLIYHINSLTAERKNSIKIDITKSEDRKYNIKIIGSSDIFELNGKNEISYEALLEVKQILKMLRLTNKENVNEDLTKFLALKVDNTGKWDCFQSGGMFFFFFYKHLKREYCTFRREEKSSRCGHLRVSQVCRRCRRYAPFEGAAGSGCGYLL